jgi:hypothetical protein
MVDVKGSSRPDDPPRPDYYPGRQRPQPATSVPGRPARSALRRDRKRLRDRG